MKKAFWNFFLQRTESDWAQLAFSTTPSKVTAVHPCLVPQQGLTVPKIQKPYKRLSTLCLHWAREVIGIKKKKKEKKERNIRG